MHAADVKPNPAASPEPTKDVKVGSIDSSNREGPLHPKNAVIGLRFENTDRRAPDFKLPSTLPLKLLLSESNTAPFVNVKKVNIVAGDLSICAIGYRVRINLGFELGLE